MGAHLRVQVPLRAGDSEQSEAQLREGDRAWEGSVERKSRADEQESHRRHRQAGFHPLERFHDLTVRESRSLHLVELLNEKILLLNAPLLRGDYHRIHAIFDVATKEQLAFD